MRSKMSSDTVTDDVNRDGGGPGIFSTQANRMDNFESILAYFLASQPLHIEYIRTGLLEVRLSDIVTCY